MKRVISFVLTLVMCISIGTSLSATASAGLFSGTETGEMRDTSAEGNGTVYWEYEYNVLRGTATLTLSGDGYMPNGTDQSWYAIQQEKQCYITELIIENGVKSIMEGAFFGEIYLTSVTLPDSIVRIGDSAFQETAIKTVELPKNLETFNGTMFNSDSIVQYYVSSENPYYTSVDGVVYSKDMKTLVAYPIGRYAQDKNHILSIPETVTEIAPYAFINSCATSYIIPGNVKSIKKQAFAGNAELSSLTLENGVESIYDGAFLACDNLTEIHLPSSVNYIGYCTLGFVYDIDYEGIGIVLDQEGISHETITPSNASYYLSLADYTVDQFAYCHPNAEATIYAPNNSAGQQYAKRFGVNYVKSQALTPTLISATSVYKGVEIKWTVSSDATGYYVYRKTKKGGWKKIATVKGQNKTTYTDSEAYSSYKNTYTVRAFNSTGSSTYNKKGISVYYIPAPRLSSAKNTTSGIKVAWKKVSTAKNYNIYRKAKGETAWELIASTDKSKLTYTDETVKNGKVYYYTVRAYDSKGVSAYNKTGVGTKFVSSPKLSSAKNTSSGVQIKWNKVSSATSYRVYRKTGNGSWKLIKKVGKDVTSYTDKTAKSGTTYKYTVRAVNDGYLSSYYSSGKTTKFLKMPEISSAKSSKSGITVKYNKIAGASGYRIYRKINGEDEWTRIATVKGNSVVSYKDTTAKKGVTYRYTVRAYNGSYSSAYNKTGYKIKDKY